jgi:DNA-binding winged helix-turn-helix (wHTH) protein
MMEHRSFPDDFINRGFSSSLPRRRGGRSAAELASRADFTLGTARLSPSRLMLSAPGGPVQLEPRVMQVMLMLADARGGVVTREQLIVGCWGGPIVGDDAVNRAIAELRRALRQTSAAVNVETIPKVGYRLDIGGDWPEQVKAGLTSPWLSRRVLMAGGAASLAVAALAGWRAFSARRDPHVADLLQRGRMALRDELPDSTQQGIGFFKEALQLAPDNAEAWGLLALAQRNASEYAPPEQIAGAVAAVQGAAHRALDIDPAQPDALAALALLQPYYGDWLAAEKRLISLHRRFPEQVDVIAALAMLMFAVGRATDAVAYSRRAAALEPLSPIFQYRLSYQVWTVNGVGEADRTIDRALQLWPEHPGVWYARFLIFAGSGRPEQASRMIDSATADQVLDPRTLECWHRTCRAMRTQARADAIAAGAAAMAAARESGSGCVNAILALNVLRDLDRAFIVSEGYLLRRGTLSTEIGGPERTVNDQRWRKTQMLFIPATAPMRADPRFERLMADMGLAAYWRASGQTPYYRRVITA